jgi:ribosomal protein L32
MPEPPELAYETATPQQLQQRLDVLRERFRTGLLSVADFNTAIKAFQFTDAVGHLWAPGATSSQWYRWDRTQWTPATPPARLNVPQAPVMFTDFEGSAAAARAASPTTKICPKCGVTNIGKKFCTDCGTELGLESAAAAPPPASSTTGTCPKCGAVSVGKKFCIACGEKIG